MWRRLLHCYSEYPWRLVRLLGGPQEALEEARQLFLADEGVLDLGFSAKLRELAGDPSELLTLRWQRFLQHVFPRIILSNAHCEGLFAQYKQWQCRSYKPWGLALLQARATLAAWWRAAEKRRGCNKRGRRSSCKKARPVWVTKRGEHGKLNAMHILTGQCLRQHLNAIGLERQGSRRTFAACLPCTFHGQIPF